jgi:hypothetical protein
MPKSRKRSAQNQPKPGPDDFDYEKYSRDALRDQAREIKALLANLNRTDALFYPASGLNWQPLHSFNDQCDVFVYGDWMIRRADFNKSINQLELPAMVGQPFLYISKLVETGIGELPGMTDLPWQLAPDALPVEPWCELAKLTCRTGRAMKTIWLLYLAGNPIAVYRSLFTRRQTAPKIVYLRQPAGIPAEAWGAFVANGGPLAAVIQENPHRPLHVLSDIGAAVLA